MATTRKKTGTEPRMTPTQMKAKIAELEEKKEKLENGAFCYMCDKHKTKDKFYQSTDPMIRSGVTPICKECAKRIALRQDKNGDYHDPTKESIKKALMYLNKPFIDSLYSASIAESSGENRTKSSAWSSYAKNISMPQYDGLTYKDSDMFKQQIIYEDEKTTEDVVRGREDQDTYSDFVKNKNDVVRLLGYDPFEKEAISDQPFLYSQLLGMLDASEDANDDMMRTASAITIVRGFLQQAKIDDTIVGLMSDVKRLQENSATIKSLQQSKGQITSVIKDLAAESCISLKNNKSAKKGENTWSGKIKRIRDLNLREGEVNGFDIATCRGMQQVMDMSNASILKQLRLDESEYSDMIAEQRELITKLQTDLENYKEISRILLRENLDLKDYLEEKGVMNPEFLVDLTKLYSCFKDEENDSQEEIMESLTEDEDNE